MEKVLIKDSQCLASGGNRVVEHLPHYLKVEDLSQAVGTSNRIEKLAKMSKKKDLNGWSVVLAEW